MEECQNCHEPRCRICNVCHTSSCSHYRNPRKPNCRFQKLIDRWEAFLNGEGDVRKAKLGVDDWRKG